MSDVSVGANLTYRLKDKPKQLQMAYFDLGLKPFCLCLICHLMYYFNVQEPQCSVCCVATQQLTLSFLSLKTLALSLQFSFPSWCAHGRMVSCPFKDKLDMVSSTLLLKLPGRVSGLSWKMLFPLSDEYFFGLIASSKDLFSKVSLFYRHARCKICSLYSVIEIVMKQICVIKTVPLLSLGPVLKKSWNVRSTSYKLK